jgi:hypothetical protein
LDDEGCQLQQSNADTSNAETNNPPIGLSGILYLLGFLGGFGLALAGVEKLDGDGIFSVPRLSVAVLFWLSVGALFCSAVLTGSCFGFARTSALRNKANPIGINGNDSFKAFMER